MPIPDFQSTMRPLLEFLKDGKERSNSEIYDALEQHFHLTEDERRKLLPSGKQRVFINRVAWSKSHLKQARLLESPRRGVYKITPRGLDFLRKALGKITIKHLMQFNEFQQFRGKKPTSENSSEPEADCDAMTPQEHIEFGHNKLNEELSRSMIDALKSCSPAFFEQIVLDLMLAMGYGGSRENAGSLTSKGADEGVDGIINEDKLGLDVIYIQAKRWESNVSRPEIQKFAGALLGKKAKKGIFITTSSFSKDAVEFTKQIETTIILIDGAKLTDLMIEYNVGVTTSQKYEIKRIDTDYFSEE